MSTPQTEPYDVAIIGGGVSGSALLYTLAEYSTISHLVLLEKHANAGQVNSHAHNNSQTLHTGDIETNYSPQRAAKIKPAANMIWHYCQKLAPAVRTQIIKTLPKMILGVGTTEVALLTKRWQDLSSTYPELQLLTAVDIANVEPQVMNGRDPAESVIALFNPQGHAVNFGALAQSFIVQAQLHTEKTIDTFFSNPVTDIWIDSEGLYHLITNQREVIAKVVVVDADAYSLWFAKKLGYGHEYSLIPMAGTFYFSKQYLCGKVYTCQDAKLLYTAIHGDPDLDKPLLTRWGPTVRFFPTLERGQYRTIIDYFRSAGLARWRAWFGFWSILSDRDRRHFFFKNILYEIPWVGTYLFARTARKICPSIKTRDLQRARGYGGMRLQRVNINTQELEVGEKKIIGNNIIFNMTPSPGASICLYNALEDSQKIISFFNNHHTLDLDRLHHELYPVKSLVQN